MHQQNFICSSKLNLLMKPETKLDKFMVMKVMLNKVSREKSFLLEPLSAKNC